MKPAFMARSRAGFHVQVQARDETWPLVPPDARADGRLMLLMLASQRPARRPALAQSVLRDSETELLFKDMSRAADRGGGARSEQRPGRPAQRSGDQRLRRRRARRLYSVAACSTAADNVNQLQGVIAHELGHVAGGHSIRMQEGAKQATGISICCAGAWRAGDRRRRRRCRRWDSWRPASRPRWASSWRSPAPRKPAPTGRRQYLSARRGISGKGMLEFFKKLQNQEYRLAIYAKDSYDRTHPLSQERIQALDQRLREAIRPGTSRPIRRSRPASNGSRPS